MTTPWSASRLGRATLVALGLLGLFLTVDVLLAYGFALLALLTGGVFNPYIGIVLFLVLPAILTAGVLLMRWTWPRLVISEAPREAAVQRR